MGNIDKQGLYIRAQKYFLMKNTEKLPILRSHTVYCIRWQSSYTRFTKFTNNWQHLTNCHLVRRNPWKQQLHLFFY